MLLVGDNIAVCEEGERWDDNIGPPVPDYLECLKSMVIGVPRQSWHVDTGQKTRDKGLGTKWRSKLLHVEDKNGQLRLKEHSQTKWFKQSTVPPQQYQNMVVKIKNKILKTGADMRKSF